MRYYVPATISWRRVSNQFTQQGASSVYLVSVVASKGDDDNMSGQCAAFYLTVYKGPCLKPLDHRTFVSVTLAT
jgi:hypothetical protein